MKQYALLLVFVFVAAICTPQAAKDALTQGTDVVLDVQEPIEYALIIDRSGSMQQGGRFAEATGAARAFITQLRSDDRATIIGFDRRSTVYSELSSDQEDLLAAIARMRIGDFTQYNQGLAAATTVFQTQSQYDTKVAVFLSDGKPDDRSEVLEESVYGLLGQQACIYTIAYADAADEQAQQELQSIAQSSQNTLSCGGYFRAEEDSYDLRRIYNEIFDVTTDANVLDVEVFFSDTQEPELIIDVLSSFSGESLLGTTCFAPEIETVILRDNQVVSEQKTSTNTIPIQLPAGEYNYVVRAQETCGGTCVYTGEAEGSFSIDATQAACILTADELSVLASSSASDVISITSEGFDPQTIGTDGLVTWRNDDTVAHQIIGIDEAFQSPVLQPGESWSYAFSQGEHGFVDATGMLQGSLRSERQQLQGTADLVLVLDQSGSMAGAPLTNAKSASGSLLEILRPGDRGSLIVFSDTAQLVQPLTSDIETLQNAVNSVRSQGATFYIRALELAGGQLSRTASNRDQVLIFLSDGAPAESTSDILRTLSEQMGDSCVYTIGYGKQGEEAVELLANMADLAQEQNSCGLFYFSEAEEEELAQIFGEVYALTTQQSLEFVNLDLPDSSIGKFSVQTQVHSILSGRALPSSEGSLCLPAADVELVIAGERYPLVFDGETYSTDVKLKPGTYTATLTARVIPDDDSSRSVVGSVTTRIRVRSWTIFLWLIPVISGVLVLVGKAFNRQQPPPTYGY